jgi:hypothetical protein
MVYSKKQIPSKAQEMTILIIRQGTTPNLAAPVVRLTVYSIRMRQKKVHGQPSSACLVNPLCPSRVGDKDSPDSSAWNGDQTAALHGSIHMKVNAYQNFKDGQITF